MLTNAEFQGVFVAMLYKTNIDHQMTNDAANLKHAANLKEMAEQKKRSTDICNTKP